MMQPGIDLPLFRKKTYCLHFQGRGNSRFLRNAGKSYQITLRYIPVDNILTSLLSD